MEIHDGLKLEAGNLSHGYGLVCGIQCHIGVGNADISYHEHFIKNVFMIAPVRAVVVVFPLVPVMAMSLPLCHMVSQLDLTPDRNLGLIQNRHERSI